MPPKKKTKVVAEESEAMEVEEEVVSADDDDDDDEDSPNDGATRSRLSRKLDNDRKANKNEDNMIQVLFLTSGRTHANAGAVSVQHQAARADDLDQASMALHIDRHAEGVAALIAADVPYPDKMKAPNVTCCIIKNYCLDLKHPETGTDLCFDDTQSGIVCDGIRSDGPWEGQLELSNDRSTYFSNDPMVPFACQVCVEASNSGLGKAGAGLEFNFANYENLVEAYRLDTD